MWRTLVTYHRSSQIGILYKVCKLKEIKYELNNNVKIKIRLILKKVIKRKNFLYSITMLEFVLQK